MIIRRNILFFHDEHISLQYEKICIFMKNQNVTLSMLTCLLQVSLFIGGAGSRYKGAGDWLLHRTTHLITAPSTPSSSHHVQDPPLRPSRSLHPRFRLRRGGREGRHRSDRTRGQLVQTILLGKLLEMGQVSGVV